MAQPAPSPAVRRPSAKAQSTSSAEKASAGRRGTAVQCTSSFVVASRTGGPRSASSGDTPARRRAAAIA